MVRLSDIIAKSKPRPRLPRVRLPGDLAVVTYHWNPAGYESLRRNYLRFLHEMRWWNVHTFAVEVAYDGQEFVNDAAWLKIRATDRNVIWQKERLVNLAAERLPQRFDKIAWIDADMVFWDSRLIEHTCEALESWPVVQMWRRWYRVDAHGAVDQVLESIGYRGETYAAGGNCSPGGALAARRSVFPLYDRHIVGSGDSMCLEGWIGMEQSRCMKRMNEPMWRHFAEWQREAHAKVGGEIGILPGDAVHLHHGRYSDRKYRERWQPVIDSGYDPARHVRVGDNGLLEWTDSAPEALVEFVRGYFASRNEDG